MNTNLSKFDLIASMMKRLDVSPSALTMNWLQEQVLSFACLARSSHQDEPEQRLVGTFVSLELLPAAVGHAVSLPRDEEVASSSAEVQVPQIFGSQNKEAEQKLSADDPSGKNVFYDGDWGEPGREFELNAETVFSVRCGMFAYVQGAKVIISPNPLSQKQLRGQNLVPAGVLFDRQEDKLLALRVCEPRSGYGRALKKLPSGCRFPCHEDCEKMFVYQELLHEAFRKQHINFRGMEKFFYEAQDCPKTTACIFDLKQGTTEKLPAKSAVSGSYCVRVLNIN